MKRTKEEAAITRRAILDAALELFRSQGYASTSIDQIGAAVGVTRGAVYWHFTGKADVLEKLIEDYSGRFDGLIQQAIQQGGTFLEIGHRVMAQPLTVLETDKQLSAFIELVNSHIVDIPEMQAIREQRIAAAQVLIENVAQFMQMGIDQGALRPDLDPVEVAQAYIAQQNGLIHLWMSLGRSFSLTEAANTAAQIFARGIAKVAD